MVRSGVMPTPPASSSAGLAAARARREERAEGPLREDPGARPERAQHVARVADVADRDPHQVVARQRRQRVRVRLPPQPAGEEPPAEELARGGVELAQVPSADIDRNGAVRLFAHARHDPAVAGEVADRDDDPVPDDQRRGRDVQQFPGEPGGRVLDEGGAVGELVAERQRDRQVGVEVQVVPGLVAEPTPQRPQRGEPHPEQQEVADGRHQHVGVGGEQRRRLADHVRVRGQRVAPDDEQHVPADDPAQHPAEGAVPAGQPVGADPALDRRQPRHQQHRDHHPVPGQQAEALPDGGQRTAGADDGVGGMPPQGEDRGRAGGDQRQRGGRADSTQGRCCLR